MTQLLVLQAFIRSPNTVHTSLCMANDEMNTICELDVQLVRRKNHHLWMYFAERDDWVGVYREHILEAFSESGNEEHSRIVLGAQGIPHAFCISMCYNIPLYLSPNNDAIDHSEQLARQCFDWMYPRLVTSQRIASNVDCSPT